MARLVVALVALSLSSCSCRKSDAVRAREERETIEKRLRDSLTLFPWRLLKIALRSKDSPKRPKAIDEVEALIDETRALPETPATAAETAQVAATYARLIVALVEARSSMKERDEDEFPTLWETYVTEPPPRGYDSGQEHLGLAAAWLVIDSADKSDHVPGSTELAFYELSRATPAPGWPAWLTAAASLARGTAFCAARSHYAAEEELTTYLTTMEALPEPLRRELGTQQLDAAQMYGGWLAAGYFVRAWNRHELGREDASTDDLERGLAVMERAGFDNELTDWTWAVVHARRHRWEECAQRLEKLATSPNLDPDAQQALREAAHGVRTNSQGLPVLLEARATRLIVQALLRRAGGLEHVLVTVFGEKTGREVYAPLAWLNRTRTHLGQAPSDVLERGKSAGSKALEVLERRLGAMPDGGIKTP